ncbi:M56 family metallopeptidase, partial [Rhodopirellula baltica]
MNTFSDHFVLWVINVLIHSTVLAAVLLCVAMLFRRRAAMRYWILCCGLLLVLASPAVSALVQSQGSGCLTLALPSETAPTVTVAVAEQPTWANDSPMKSLPTQHVDASIAPPVLDAGRMEEIASTPVVSKPMMVADVRANPSPPTPAVKDSRSPMQWLAIIVTIATVIWAVVATLLLMRMAIGWIRLAGILRRAEPIADPDCLAAFTKACALTGCREGHTPCLVASNEISGPLAAGIFAGSVVLPKRLIADSRPTELAEVFVHEVAHVVRRDQIVVLLQNLVAAIYWPHPLVRKLNRELAKAREEVCDNFVLATTEAPIYSRTLLSLAQLVQQPETIPGSVGFFASRWKLEHRVAGLLDEARDTQTFLSRRGWAFVLASTVGLLAAICVGTVTIATAQNSNEDSVAESEANSSEIEISGIVCEQSGDPIGGATIWLAVTSFEFNSEVNMENREGLLRELGSTDERGRFDFLLDEATTSEIRECSRFARVQIVATSDGHGMDWLPLDVFQDDPIPNKERDLLQSRIDDAFGDGRFASRTLVMRPESQPVRGRIIDLEGNKLSNVTVIVESLRQPNVPQLTNALENAWKQGVYDAMNSTGIAGGLARSELQKLFPPAKTDENGEFQIRGIGDDQLATLVFQDERIEACPVHVVGREMETLSLPHMDQYPDGTKDLFVGREFNYSAAPSIPVEGTVTDYDTGKPISGVLVSVERLFRREYAKLRLDTRQMRAVTDEQGRFRIIGMPPGDGHIIEAVPPKSEPYLPAPQEVSLSLEDGKTKRIEIQVKRGVWIEGRITDKESGEPRSAAIEYMAMGKNPYAMDIAGWDPKLRLDPVRVYQRYVTDSDGRYRLPGLSGPGVLLVTSLDPGYPLAAGAETIDGYDPSTGKIPTLPVPFPASDWHLLKQINPAKDATSLTSDLTLDGGVRIPGRVVGPDGKPISNLYALGLTEGDPYWTPNSPDKALLTERFMVNGYDGKGPRQSFFKNQDETLVGQYRLEGTAPPEIAVKLEPSVRVTGRLIENETGLPAARYFVGCQELLLNGNAPPLDFMIRWCHTNNAGEFEIKGLMAGHVYKMKAHNRIGNKVDFTIDLTKAKPGETIELADVPQPGTHGANDSISSSTMKKSNAVASVSTGSRQNKSEDQAAHSPIRITGRVIDPNGNPVSGAKIFYAGS